MDAINTELLTRIKRAFEHEQDLSVHYSAQIVAATEVVRQRAITEGLRRHDLADVQTRRPGRQVAFAGAQDGERRDATALLRDQEATMRRLAQDATAAGHLPHHVTAAMAAFAQQAAQPDLDGFERALQAATEARQAAEAALSSLEAKRGAHGKRAAWLRQSVREAEDHQANRPLQLMATTATWTATAGIDTAAAHKVVQLLEEIERVRQARPPVEQEVQTELLRLETIAARGEAAPLTWLSPNPAFSTAAFAEAVTAALLLVAPDLVRETVAKHARRQAESWAGLRMTTIEQERQLTKLETDLRKARASLEMQRRHVESSTNDVLPRVGPIDHPEIWLMMDPPLAELAATEHGRRTR